MVSLLIVKPKIPVTVAGIGFVTFVAWGIMRSVYVGSASWYTVGAIVSMPIVIYVVLAYASEVITMTRTGISASNTVSLCGRSFCIIKRDSFRWEDVTRVKRANTFLLVTTTILMQCGQSAIISIGSMKTNFKEALLFVLQHVDDSIVDDDVLRLANKYRDKMGVPHR